VRDLDELEALVTRLAVCALQGAEDAVDPVAGKAEDATDVPVTEELEEVIGDGFLFLGCLGHGAAYGNRQADESEHGLSSRTSVPAG